MRDRILKIGRFGGLMLALNAVENCSLDGVDRHVGSCSAHDGLGANGSAPVARDLLA